MPRDPNIPAAFDVYALVLLWRPRDVAQLPEAELPTTGCGWRRGLRRAIEKAYYRAFTTDLDLEGQR